MTAIPIGNAGDTLDFPDVEVELERVRLKIFAKLKALRAEGSPKSEAALGKLRRCVQDAVQVEASTPRSNPRIGRVL